MVDDETRRWHEHVRRKEAGVYEEILPLRDFEEQFQTASAAVQRAVRKSFSIGCVFRLLRLSMHRIHCHGVEAI